MLRFGFVVVLFFGLVQSAFAGVMAGSLTIPSNARQSIFLPAGSPLNPGTEDAFVRLKTPGSFSISWSATNEMTFAIDTLSARFEGFNPVIGNHVVAGDETLPGFVGTITVNSMTADGKIIDGILSINSQFTVDLLDFGVSLITDGDPPPLFVGPVSQTQSLGGAIYTDPDRTNDPLLSPDSTAIVLPTADGPIPVGTTYNRTVEAVPEPATITVFAMRVMGICFGHVRRTKKNPRCLSHNPPRFSATDQRSRRSPGTPKLVASDSARHRR